MNAPEFARGLPRAPSTLLDAPAALDTPAAVTSSLFDGRRAAGAQRESVTAPAVLFVDQSGQLGGAEFALLPLAADHAARGEVVLLSEGPFRTKLEAAGVKVRMLVDARVSGISRQSLRFGWLRALPAIARQTLGLAREAQRHEVVFANTQKALVLSALGKPFHRRPLIWYQHDILSREHFGRMQLTIVKWLVRLAVDQVIANSRASAHSLVALTGCALDAIRVVHNGIDAAAFMPPDSGATLNARDAEDLKNTQHATVTPAPFDGTDMRALRQRLGLPPGAWIAGLFGRLAPWKGQHVALDALARLPDTHLVLVGTPLFGEQDYERALRQQAETLGIADRVHFAGFQHDVPSWMRAMDVILHTSISAEPFGRVVVEGMAAGRAVIAAAAGGVPEIVTHRRNGWLVTPGDVAGLVDAIDTLRNDPALRQRLAHTARDDARTRFSVERYLDLMNRAIEDVARHA
jgi:glycosyltransferase involved in cell wall biosynthesis